ncbi:MAG: ABC transporter permease [Verrucomicrobia bacterium]|nr:ABC transporter permease [Verrucomicrobiota bacterium]
MTLARIILNNARQRLLSTALTSLSVAVGVALIIAILTIKLVSQERLRVGYSGFDLVIGAKGSPLQLVLNVVYHLDTSPGNIPFSLYEKLAKDSRVKFAVPFSVGDSFQGFRVVGTTDAFLKNFEPRPNQPFELANGRIFRFDDAELREAMRAAVERGRKGPASSSHDAARAGHGEKERHRVIHYEAVLGSAAAEETGLKTGQPFVAAHGIQESVESGKHEESPWMVVGILKPTGTPADRAIYINLDSFYHIEGHVIEESKPLAGKADSSGGGEKKGAAPEAGQISALALKLRTPFAVFGLRKQINEAENAQAAIPAEEIRKLLAIVGNVDRILLAQAVLIVVVSGIGAGLAMFNSMNERRRDIAVMRALGARRRAIVAIVVGEAALIAGIGGVMGVALGHGAIQVAAPAVRAAIGFAIAGSTFHFFEVFVVFGVLLVGVLAGIGPAVSAYRTDVSTNLSPNA